MTAVAHPQISRRKYRGGFHDFLIDTGGVRVFPRLVSVEHRGGFTRETVGIDNAEMNGLIGGGFERGASTLILGPAGTAKSLLTLSFVKSAIARGEHAAMFIFDEELGLLFDCAKALDIDPQAMVDTGRLTIEQIDAAEMTPGEFSARVRHRVEKPVRRRW